MTEYIFKVGDKGLTYDGTPYRVVATDLKGMYPVLAVLKGKEGSETPVTRTATGRHSFSSSSDFLPPKNRVWLNIYPIDCSISTGVGTAIYASRVYADMQAGPKRIACIEIAYTPGEGLNK